MEAISAAEQEEHRHLENLQDRAVRVKHHSQRKILVILLKDGLTPQDRPD